jgi:predicted nucleic acid-binding protein
VAGYVLDTSAIMAVLYREDGRPEVEALFQQPEPILVPFMAMMEVHYKIMREFPDTLDRRLALVSSWPVDVIESTPEWREIAAAVKAPGRVSTADAWVAALALHNDAVLVHKDPEFERVRQLRELRLPYKPREARS